MADNNKLVGRDYQTPDLVAKVTGKARFAEDFKAEGMLFAKLLLSPMPHAKITRIDASAALAMPGVKAILTADDLAAPADSITDTGMVVKANLLNERSIKVSRFWRSRRSTRSQPPRPSKRFRSTSNRCPSWSTRSRRSGPAAPTREPRETCGISRRRPSRSPGPSRPRPRRQESKSSNGRNRISPPPRTVNCRWARRPIHGRWVTGKQA